MSETITTPFIRRLFPLILLLPLIAFSLSACLESGPPAWALRLTPTSGPRPTVSNVSIQRVVDPASVQPGHWQWRSFHTDAAAHPPAQLWLDVAAGGAAHGVLSIYPDDPAIPQSGRTLIQQNGCNVELNTLTPEADSPFSVHLISRVVARIAVDVSECTVRYFGPVTLAEPLRGEFVVAYDAELTEMLIRAASQPLTPVEIGRNVFARNCSGCHGSYGEGMPGIPGLVTDQVRGYTDEQILTIVRSGVNNAAMPAWGNILSEEELLGTLAFIRELGASGS
ncbi:MAG: c-type cytochrome [Candidatus Flexifilum sp.]|jgi:cytochrome c553